MTTYLFAAFAFLQAVDVVTTWAILRRGGAELNPLLARAFTVFGVLPTLIGAKAALLAAGWLLLPSVADFVDPVVPLIGVVAAYVGIVANNIHQWRLTG